MRSHVDVMRYPKLVLDNHHQMTMEGHPGSLGSSHHQRVGVNPEGLQSNGSRPPLARAVHLTLGVAVLGRYGSMNKYLSLLATVFPMIHIFQP